MALPLPQHLPMPSSLSGLLRRLLRASKHSAFGKLCRAPGPPSVATTRPSQGLVSRAWFSFFPRLVSSFRLQPLAFSLSFVIPPEEQPSEDEGVDDQQGDIAAHVEGQYHSDRIE